MAGSECQTSERGGFYVKKCGESAPQAAVSERLVIRMRQVRFVTLRYPYPVRRITLIRLFLPSANPFVTGKSRHAWRSSSGSPLASG